MNAFTGRHGIQTETRRNGGRGIQALEAQTTSRPAPTATSSKYAAGHPGRALRDRKGIRNAAAFRGRKRTKHSLIQQVLRVLENLYDAAIEPAGWPRALDALADTVGAHVAALGRCDATTKTVVDLAPRLDPDYVRVYEQHWADRNPFRQMWQPNPPLGVITPELFMPRDEYTRTELFQEWVRPQQIEAAMATNTLLDNGVTTVLRLYRPWRIGDFEAADVQLFAALIPHIQRAVQLQHRLAALNMQRTGTAAAFDRLRDGVVIVDRQLRIVFANRTAEELLAEGDALRRDDAGLAAATPEDTAALRRLIVGGHNGNPLPGAGGRRGLSRGDGRMPLEVLVVPLRGDIAWASHDPWATALFVSDPDRDCRSRAATLRRRFGLTRAETALLVEIVKGDGLRAAAERLGVSLATARTHLRHVFDKTGTRRQAELVNLAAAERPMLREDA